MVTLSTPASYHRVEHAVNGPARPAADFFLAGAAGELDQVLVELEPDPVVAVDAG